MATFPLSDFKHVGNLFFVSGQIGKQGDKLASEDIAEQVIQTVENIKAILEQNGMSIKNVVDVTAFLVNQDDYAVFNEAYRKSFAEPYPTRTTVTVKSLPLGAKVELKAIAAMPEFPVTEVRFER